MSLQQELSADQTDTEQAIGVFGERASRLSGVLSVEPCAAVTASVPAFVVYVPKGALDARNSVYDLESELYSQYPEARLDIHVREVG